MSTVSNVAAGAQVLPRTVLDLSLRTVRLPVTLAARATGQQDNAQWPPTVAFEGLQATVESTVGGWLHDDALVEKSRLRQQKLGQLRKAAGLEEAAAQEQAEAERAYEQQTERAQDAARAAAKRADTRKSQAQKRAANTAQQVEHKAAKRKQSVRAADAKRKKAIDRQDRARTLAALDHESRALATTSAALGTKAAVDNVDQAIESSKAARKAD